MNKAKGQQLYQRKKSGGIQIRYPPGVVILNVYDVVDHPFQYELAKMMTLGIHHTGVQIGNREFSFTLEGIVITEPRPRMARCKLTASFVEATHATSETVHFALSRLQYQYTALTYDPLHRNCNHFSAALVKMITGKRVPGWINRAPTMAGMLGTRFRLKRAAITAPPVSWSVLLPALEAYDFIDDPAVNTIKPPPPPPSLILNQHPSTPTTPRGSKVVKFLPPSPRTQAPATDSRILAAKEAHYKMRAITPTNNNRTISNNNNQHPPHISQSEPRNNKPIFARSNSEFQQFPEPNTPPFLRRTQSNPDIDTEITPTSWGDALAGIQQDDAADDIYDEPASIDSPHRLEKSTYSALKEPPSLASVDLEDEPISDLSRASRIVLLEQVY